MDAYVYSTLYNLVKCMKLKVLFIVCLKNRNRFVMYEFRLKHIYTLGKVEIYITFVILL